MGKYFLPSSGKKSWKSLLTNPKKQWKSGYSAKELAKCWEEAEGFPTSVVTTFEESQITLLKDVEFLFGFPEYKVSLLGGSATSQNDLYVLAKAGKELLTIMVEGKVTESFGATIETWKEKNPTSGKIERLFYLLDTLNLKEDSVLEIRYQLLHRAASALIEAHRVQANHALILVHSFSETGKGYEDYADFVKLFDLTPKEDKVVGPISLNGVNVYFGWINEVKEVEVSHIDENKILLPNTLRGRSIHENVIPTVGNIKNMIKKLTEVNGDLSQLKSWEKRSFRAYQIDDIKSQVMEASQSDQIKLIRNHILNGDPADFGASCIDIYLVAFVAENYGAGKETFIDYVMTNGITDKANSAQAIWQVGKGDGVFLNILHKDGSVKDWSFIASWIKGPIE
ncbi:DUF6946 family protein [Salipaludibacillus sp. HK11]|uniref:DUF6946 family protein n=1 Tax=Salipaludibacillus sp. HK11 TaxID=3394320 RepID=UPI0039FC2773